jgi:outer membrane protein assembly factor BamC
MLGCSSVGNMFEPDRLDYKSASKASTTNLEVPPDLTQLQRENRYAVPDTSTGVAKASDFKAEQESKVTGTTPVIVPKSIADIRVERDANQRWLVANKSPEVLWQQIKDFWQDSGFVINVEKPESGIMETDWAEKRLNVPKGIVGRTVGSVISGLQDTGERDKFRTRLERRADGMTEIYISHRGAVEELVNTGGGDRVTSTKWTSRPADPNLEADALSRLMVRLGVEGEKAKNAVASAKALPPRAKLVKAENGAYVEDDEEFDRAWRRVGLALDRVGFTVEDRDRTQGLYFVRYVDPDAKKDDGFLSKLFYSSDDPSKLAQRYRVSVKGTGTTSQVAVQDSEGKPEKTGIADKILVLLTEQLK